MEMKWYWRLARILGTIILVPLFLVRVFLLWDKLLWEWDKLERK